MARSALLFALVGAVGQGQAPIVAPDAQATQEKQIEALMSDCLSDWHNFDVEPAEAKASPPGLSRLAGFRVQHLAGPLQAYVYRSDWGEGTMRCGVAVYGDVSPALIDDLRAKLSRWYLKKVDLRYYQLPGAVPGKEEYWSNSTWLPRSGLSIIERSPSARAPTIEAEYHLTPVQ